VNNGKEIRVVFMDISKAFDRVWHKGLLHKLKINGITGKLLEWLKDYLTDREQRVIINGEHSEWGHIKAGVPQGSVLGPLLFLIFINDVTHVVRNCKIRLFADDTCLFIEVDDHGETGGMIDEDLNRLNAWAEKWKITFSPPKTKELLVSKKRNPPLHPQANLAGTFVDIVTQHKHLGLTISKDLSWKAHIEQITDKANRRLGILRSLKYKLNRSSLETIYKSLIRPILEYGDIVWSSPSQNLDCLESVQLNAARVVTGATARCSTQGLYNETCWEPLSERRDFHRLTLFYKIMHNNAPQYLIDLIPRQVQDRTTYNLRNSQRLDLPNTRTNLYDSSFFPTTARLWNNLSQDIKNLPSIESFKAHHRRNLPKPNPLFYIGGRLEACIHARLRIMNSPLKEHLCKNLNVIASPLCDCAAGVNESPNHFFFDCSKYDAQRMVLVNDLLPFVINNCKYLLFGVPSANPQENGKIFEAVFKYIRDTKRFY
jgi:hypothetical protein